MASSFKWHGQRFMKALQSEMRRRLTVCAIAVWAHAKLLISVDGTGKRVKTYKDKAGRTRRRTVLHYGANPSRPGEPPRRQTGRLLGSVAWEISAWTARVGTNVRYGRWLELATSRMAARPWLRRALKEMRGFIRAVMFRPWNPPP